MLVCQCLHLVKPDRHVICRIINRLVFSQDCLCIILCALRHTGIIRPEQLREHKVHICLDFTPECQILTGLLSAAANGKELAGQLRITYKQRMECRIIVRAPLGYIVVYLIRIHAGDNILADIPQLFHIKQRTGNAHLLRTEREIIEICGLICLAPFLKVGIEQCHQIFHDSRYRDTLLVIIGQCQLRVLSLGQLALGTAIHFHQLRGMHILRTLPAHDIKQLQMYRQGCQPLLTTYHMGGMHQMVINNVGKMIGRNAIRLEQDNILIVLRQLQIALDQIGMANLVFNAARGTEPDNIAFACCQMLFNFLQRTVTVLGILAIITEVLLVGLLLCMHFRQLFLGTEAGIRIATLDQVFNKDMINGSTLALAIWAISSIVTVNRCAFIKGQAKILKGFQNQLHAAFYFTLFIGILNTQIKNTAGLMCQTFIHHCTEQIAQMHKSGGAWCHTCYLCAFRQVTGRITSFHFLRRFGYFRKEQLCQTIIIHCIFTPIT